MQAAARETSAGLQLASGKGIGPATMSPVCTSLPADVLLHTDEEALVSHGAA